MNLFSTTTKTIKTYGKKNAERVVNINTWNYEVDKKLGETVNLSGSNPIHDTAKKNSLKRSTTSKPQTNKDVTSKNAEKKPTERKTFIKGFTKSKHYVSPIQPPLKSKQKETSYNMENVSPKLSISSKTIREKTPSPIKSQRMPLTPKKHKNKYHSQTEDHDHCNEPLSKVVIKSLKPNILGSPCKIIHNEKENLYNSSLERTSYIEIEKLIKGREQITDELTELLKICNQKQLWDFEEFLGIEWVESPLT